MNNLNKIHIKIAGNNSDNPSDSLTTYSLMAVLAGGFFVQILIAPTDNVLLSPIDNLVILFFSGVSVSFILLAVEIIIDIFHFTSNNNKTKLPRKYLKQLLRYNFGVLFLVITFIYAFWAYLIKHAGIYFKMVGLNGMHSGLLCKYIVLVILVIITTGIVGMKWIKDIRFLLKTEVIIETTVANDNSLNPA